jgi:hypothetical protein
MLPRRLLSYRNAHASAPTMLGTAKPFSAYNAERHEGRDKNVPWMNKQKTADFLRAHGLRTAQTFHILDHPEDITHAHLSDRCVVKPVYGTRTTGVMVLRRAGDVFYDLLRRETVTLKEIRDVQRESQEKYAAQFSFRSSKVLIEEAILDEDGPDMVPLDYKAWTFNGRVAFIEQVNRNTSPKSLAWYVEDFHPVEVEDFALCGLGKFRRGPHRLPRCRDDILRIAKAASLALRTPYIRVDIYATPDGAAIGELTPAPGNVYHRVLRFQPWFDQLLGLQWASAIKELQSAERRATPG